MSIKGSGHVPLGYSPVMGRNDSYKIAMQFRSVLGKYEDLSFRILRFGEEFFEVTMTRTAVKKTRWGKTDLIETVAGKTGDKLRLSGGEFITIGKQRGNELELTIESA